MRFFTQGFCHLPTFALEYSIANALAHRPVMRIEHNGTVFDGPDVESKEMGMILKKLEEDKNIIKSCWI